MSSVLARAKWVRDEALLFNDPESPFRVAISGQYGRCLVVTGPNASGKSLFVRIIGVIARQDGIVPVSVSIRERTGSGLGEMAGLARVMMFGDETDQSTGATSTKVVETAFKNVDRPSLLIIDEPEVGLAECYARALGEFIGAQVNTLSKHCRGLIIVSHSRELVRGVVDGLGRSPSHAAVSADETPKAGLAKWLAGSESPRTVDDLLALPQVGHERWLKAKGLLVDS